MNDNKPKRSLFQRILAIIAVIIIVGLVITTTILGIIGHKLFTAFLFLSIMSPIILYICMWLYRTFNKD